MSSRDGADFGADSPSVLDLDTYRLEVRLDSQPAGKRPNDISYFATLLWKF